MLAAGTASSDLLWLETLRYAGHVRDVTRPGDPGRQFRGATSLTLTPDSCFFLTHAGDVFAHENGLRGPRRRREARSGTSNGQSPAERIHWNRDCHELRVDGKLAKRYTHAAPVQWSALDKFQLDGWKGPIEIEPPGDPKRDPAQRLRELIADLNSGLDTSLIHFRKDCEGLRVTFDIP